MGKFRALVGGACCGIIWFGFWQGARALSALLGVLVSAPFGVFAVIVFLTLSKGAGPWPAMGMLYVGALNLIFLYLIKAPTALGRKVLDHVDGFAHYLSVAEEERLNLENPPEETPELFERFLPYALALGCEQQWAEKFDAILQAAGIVPGDSGYSPSYYHLGWNLLVRRSCEVLVFTWFSGNCSCLCLGRRDFLDRGENILSPRDLTCHPHREKSFCRAIDRSKDRKSFFAGN